MRELLGVILKAIGSGVAFWLLLDATAHWLFAISLFDKSMFLFVIWVMFLDRFTDSVFGIRT